jgi:hypothetical protein
MYVWLADVFTRGMYVISFVGSNMAYLVAFDKTFCRKPTYTAVRRAFWESKPPKITAPKNGKAYNRE